MSVSDPNRIDPLSLLRADVQRLEREKSMLESAHGHLAIRAERLGIMLTHLLLEGGPDDDGHTYGQISRVRYEQIKRLHELQIMQGRARDTREETMIVRVVSNGDTEAELEEAP